MAAFKFREEYMDALEGLAQEVRAKLFDAIFSYAFNREEPAFNGLERAVFVLIKGMIDADEKHEKELSELQEKLEAEKRAFSEYGKKGGRPRKTPFSESKNPLKTPLKPPFNPLSEENELPLDEKEGEKERSKEKVQERDSIPQEKELPPYNPPEGETGEGMKDFLREFPNVKIDIISHGELYGINFAELTKHFRISPFLSSRYSLRWIVKNYPDILRGVWDGMPASGIAPRASPQVPDFGKYFPKEDEIG